MDFLLLVFVVPQDIQFNFGNGKISYYARNGSNIDDAHGYNNNIVVGGFSKNPISDNTGPEIKLYMNNQQFVSGELPMRILLS